MLCITTSFIDLFIILATRHFCLGYYLNRRISQEGGDIDSKLEVLLSLKVFIIKIKTYRETSEEPHSQLSVTAFHKTVGCYNYMYSHGVPVSPPPLSRN